MILAVFLLLKHQWERPEKVRSQRDSDSNLCNVGAGELSCKLGADRYVGQQIYKPVEDGLSSKYISYKKLRGSYTEKKNQTLKNSF